MARSEIRHEDGSRTIFDYPDEPEILTKITAFYQAFIDEMAAHADECLACRSGRFCLDGERKYTAMQEAQRELVRIRGEWGMLAFPTCIVFIPAPGEPARLPWCQKPAK